MDSVDTLYISEEEAIREGGCDQIKLGAIACLGHHLRQCINVLNDTHYCPFRALHLDRCFSPSVGAQLVSMIGGMRSLEQLQVTNVNHDFISKVEKWHS